MQTRISILIIIAMFLMGPNLVQAEGTSNPTPTKKEKVVKKKKVIKNKTAAKKSVPLGTVAPAAPQKIENKRTTNWIKELKKKLARTQARQNQIVAVAAVRGNETPDSPPLYWKGKKASGDVAMPEVSEFDAALDTALKGNDQESIQALESFVSKYPNSPLADEAKGTIARLQDDSMEETAQPQ